MGNDFIKIFNLFILVFPFLVLLYFVFIKKKKSFKFDYNRLAKSWERSSAFIIDLLICLILTYICYLFLNKVGFIVGVNFLNILYFFIAAVYFSVLESSRFKATVGKMINGICVVDLSGNKISLFRALIRTVVVYVANVTFVVGLFLIIFSSNKQGFHDLVASTIVVKDQP